MSEQNYFGFGAPKENFFNFVEPGESVLVSMEQAELIQQEVVHFAVRVKVTPCVIFPVLNKDIYIPQQKIAKVTRLDNYGHASGTNFVAKARRQYGIMGDDAAMIFTNGSLTRQNFRAGINTNLLEASLGRARPSSIGCFVYDQDLDQVYRAFVIKMVPQ